MNDLFETHREWLEHHKELRDRFVHRVPPYIPPALWTATEEQRYHELNALRWKAVHTHRFDEVEAIKEEQASLGRFAPFLVVSDPDLRMDLIPTVMDDAFRSQTLTLDLLRVFLEEC
ncbi:MAG: hypothetical protein ACU0CO_18315 [Shimia sp.]